MKFPLKYCAHQIDLWNIKRNYNLLYNFRKQFYASI